MTVLTLEINKENLVLSVLQQELTLQKRRHCWQSTEYKYYRKAIHNCRRNEKKYASSPVLDVYDVIDDNKKTCDVKSSNKKDFDNQIQICSNDVRDMSNNIYDMPNELDILSGKDLGNQTQTHSDDMYDMPKQIINSNKEDFDNTQTLSNNIYDMPKDLDNAQLNYVKPHFPQKTQDEISQIKEYFQNVVHHQHSMYNVGRSRAFRICHLYLLSSTSFHARATNGQRPNIKIQTFAQIRHVADVVHHQNNINDVGQMLSTIKSNMYDKEQECPPATRHEYCKATKAISDPFELEFRLNLQTLQFVMFFSSVHQHKA
ncbi:hypothetical protein MSG28_001433 [Choristoneura fumiferana]|uniref:Uncharacterized protein n=1 Tax=Choristoneura fumiferana TaxID=7141 RepID=A0ACC0KU55_CHOFU|nr:hypothetical protein MSG28_001433 [Choristoneura fumiferana]